LPANDENGGKRQQTQKQQLDRGAHSLLSNALK